ncbi:MAG: chromosome segregation protein SMC [Puniceicoccales bacterium]
MYLREVTLNGFKSFADITRLELQPGVTAIVGPNGCGKSNISDSIRWVLGEQSAKSLRGGSMQDIIFGGSEKRKALPYCEVSLTFSDCEADLGASFHEVEVSRRVTRDGSSQYRINGKVSRLKDIQRLFMDTGVGQVAYSFLVQGQVDQILSTNPAERRTIFEEAAGITRYKSQRRETLNKLSLVDSNLSRVSDVIDEVSRQIGSLKRQASKAVRYKRLTHRQSHLEIALHAYQIRELDASIAEIETDSERIRTEANSHRQKIQELEESLSAERTRRAETYQEIEQLQETLFKFRSAAESAESQSQMLEVRQNDHRQRIARLKAEIQRLTDQKQELEARGAEETQSRQEKLDLLGDSDSETAKKQQEFETAARELSEKESAFRQEREAIVQVENAITRLRSRCTTLEVDLKSFEVRHASHAETVHSAKEEAEHIADRERQTLQALEQRRKDAEEADHTLETKKQDLTRTREEFRAAQTHIQEIDRQLARTAARKQVLQDLQDRMEGFGEGAKSILKGKLGEPFTGDRMKLVSSLIEVDSEYTAAAEALLGNAVDAIVWTAAEELPQLLQTLRNKGIARTALLSNGSAQDPSNRVEGLTPALSLIKPKEEAFTPLLNTLLDGCYFAETEESFLQWKSENPGSRFDRVVTQEGTVFNSNGLLVAGKTLEGSKSLLGREAEIRRIDKEISALEKELDSKRERIQVDQESIESLEADLEQSRERRNEIHRERVTLEAEAKALENSREKNTRSLHEAEDKLEALQESRKKSEQGLEEARKELADAEQKLTGNRNHIDEMEVEIETLRAQRDQRREEWTNTRLDHASRKQALEMVEKGISEIQRRTQEIDSICRSRSEEIEQLDNQIAEAAEEIELQRATHEDALENLAELQQKLEAKRAELRELEEFLSKKEESVSDSRKAVQELDQSLNRKEVELTRQRSRVEFILEKSSGENSVDVRKIDWRRSLWDADRDFKSRISLDDMEDGDDLDLDPVDRRGSPTEEDLEKYHSTEWDTVEQESKTLRDKIASMGAVNLVAIEEYKDLKERYEFLKAQSQDLWNSKEELLRAIDEINETSQTLFQKTFDKIRENFKYTYGHLTNGGTADLELIEAEDILDSGIEIKARPPGVRTATLSLLSGGQRTMAAVALLFAIYMVKPSPFCVLDELDAPLDDANIGRFTEMLKSFTEFSQFLIITHNKRTIAASNSVFGVTMQEKGVSRLVSMRFNHSTQKPEFAEGELQGKAIATE